MTDVILFGLIAAIVAAAAWYVVQAKRRGVKCIGCPAGGECHSGHGQENATGCTCSCGGGACGSCGHSEES